MAKRSQAVQSVSEKDDPLGYGMKALGMLPKAGAQGPFQHINSFSVHPSLLLLLSRGCCGVEVAASQKENTQTADPDWWISQDTELQVIQGSHLNIAFHLTVTSTMAFRANSEVCCFPCRCVLVFTYIFMLHLNSHCLIIDSQVYSSPFHT